MSKMSQIKKLNPMNLGLEKEEIKCRWQKKKMGKSVTNKCKNILNINV